MEEGSLRCDANVSIRAVGTPELGTKTEIKNMNSFRSVLRAIESEVARQEATVHSGGRVVQETRGWDEVTESTHVMRSKEEAHDYRYFPDPDLVPLEFTPADVARLTPVPDQLPQSIIRRLVEECELSVAFAHQIADNASLVRHFSEAVTAHGGQPRPVANLLLGDVSRLMNESGSTTVATTLTPAASASLAGIVASGRITSKAAKRVLDVLWNEGGSPEAIIEREGLGKVSDRDAVLVFVRDVVASEERSVADYRGGKTNALQFLKGQVMKASRGKADPAVVEELLKETIAQRA